MVLVLVIDGIAISQMHHLLLIINKFYDLFSGAVIEAGPQGKILAYSNLFALNEIH